MHPDNIKTVDTSKPKAKEESLDSDELDQEPLYRFHEEQDGLYHVNVGVENGAVQLLPLDREGGARTFEEPIPLIDQMRPALKEAVDDMIMKKVPDILRMAVSRATEEMTNQYFIREEGEYDDDIDDQNETLEDFAASLAEASQASGSKRRPGMGKPSPGTSKRPKSRTDGAQSNPIDLDMDQKKPASKPRAKTKTAPAAPPAPAAPAAPSAPAAPAAPPAPAAPVAPSAPAAPSGPFIPRFNQNPVRVGSVHEIEGRTIKIEGFDVPAPRIRATFRGQTIPGYDRNNTPLIPSQAVHVGTQLDKIEQRMLDEFRNNNPEATIDRTHPVTRIQAFHRHFSDIARSGRFVYKEQKKPIMIEVAKVFLHERCFEPRFHGFYMAAAIKAVNNIIGTNPRF